MGRPALSPVTMPGGVGSRVLGAPVPIRPVPLSRRDALLMRYRAREASAHHLDVDDRADLLVRIDDEVDARGLFRRDAHAACGLPDGTLDDGSLSTDALRAALAVLHRLPTP